MPETLTPIQLKAMLDDLVHDLTLYPVNRAAVRLMLERSRRRRARRRAALGAVGAMGTVAAVSFGIILFPDAGRQVTQVAADGGGVAAPTAQTAPDRTLPGSQPNTPASSGAGAPTDPTTSVSPAVSLTTTAAGQGWVDVGDLDGTRAMQRVRVVAADGSVAHLEWQRNGVVSRTELPDRVAQWRVQSAGNLDGRPGNELVASYADGPGRSTFAYLLTVVNGRLVTVQLDGSPFVMTVSRWSAAANGEPLAFGFGCGPTGVRLEEVNTETTHTRITRQYAWAGSGTLRLGAEQRVERSPLTAAQIDKAATGTCGSVTLTPPR